MSRSRWVRLCLVVLLSGVVAVPGPPSLASDGGEGNNPAHADLGAEPIETLAFLDEGRHVADTDGPQPSLFLTFDDGSSTETVRLLDVLDRYPGVHVTFFVNCREIVPGTMQRILDAGHALGNHTCDHPFLPPLSTWSRIDQWKRLEAFVNARVEPDLHIGCHRPPYGATNDSVRADGGVLGMREWGWNVDSKDWADPGVSYILLQLESMDDGDIIVMHDLNPAGDTIAAMDVFLQRNAAQYAFLTLPGCATGRPPVWEGRFWDDDGSVFEADIEWLADAGVTLGCDPPENTRFCPNEPLTRAQMAAFLVRALGYTDDGGGDAFVDDDGSIFEADIDKLESAGVTRGCNPPANDRFCPDGPVTREQMAALLVRALGYGDDGGGDLFVDDDGSIFEGDIDVLRTAGLTLGCNPPDNDRYCPSALVTRAQMAAFLHRALGTG